MEEGVEVSVGLLHGDDVLDHFVEDLLELRVGSCLQGIVAGLQPFGDVGIPEDVASSFVFRLKGVKASRFLAHLVVGGNAAGSVGFDPGSPEGIVDLDVFEKHGFFGLRKDGGQKSKGSESKGKPEISCKHGSLEGWIIRGVAFFRL